MNCAHLKKYPNVDIASAAAEHELPNERVRNTWPCSNCNKWHVTARPPRITWSDGTVTG